jgi:hypothetical protein
MTARREKATAPRAVSPAKAGVSGLTRPLYARDPGSRPLPRPWPGIHLRKRKGPPQPYSPRTRGSLEPHGFPLPQGEGQGEGVMHCPLILAFSPAGEKERCCAQGIPARGRTGGLGRDDGSCPHPLDGGIPCESSDLLRSLPAKAPRPQPRRGLPRRLRRLAISPFRHVNAACAWMAAKVPIP